jgi:hypothetical protein
MTYTVRVLAALVLALSTSAASAQSDDAFPDLVGTWECNVDFGSYFFGILTGPYIYERVIEEQVGAAFSGYVVWVGDKPLIPEEQYDRPGHTIVAEDETTVTVHEEFLGMIGWGTNNVHMVDVADQGWTDGTIVSPDEIELISSRSGEHAAIVRARCLKVSSD